jgi:hypothetical protein
MMARDTRTGGVLEEMVLPALRRGGYEFQKQVHVGNRLGGRRHLVDAVAEKKGEKILVSMKWQQVGGTAEQKVPFEVLCLAETVRTGSFGKAYLVLGGDKWSLRDFYVNGGLSKHLVDCGKVEIVTLERFVALANQGKL